MGGVCGAVSLRAVVIEDVYDVKGFYGGGDGKGSKIVFYYKILENFSLLSLEIGGLILIGVRCGGSRYFIMMIF